MHLKCAQCGEKFSIFRQFKLEFSCPSCGVRLKTKYGVTPVWIISILLALLTVFVLGVVATEIGIEFRDGQKYAIVGKAILSVGYYLLFVKMTGVSLREDAES